MCTSCLCLFLIEKLCESLVLADVSFTQPSRVEFALQSTQLRVEVRAYWRLFEEREDADALEWFFLSELDRVEGSTF